MTAPTPSLRVDVPRTWLLSANQRLNWRRKAERSRWLRTAARASAAAYRQSLGQRAPLEVKVRCEVQVAWPNRRRRDVHNLMPTVKPCIDGIVDARVLHDDSDQHLLGPDLRVTEQLCDPRYACTLTFVLTEVTDR